jgi:hypothetical protein
MTSIVLQTEDEFNFLGKMEEDVDLYQMEDDLNILANGR